MVGTRKVWLLKLIDQFLWPAQLAVRGNTGKESTTPLDPGQLKQEPRSSLCRPEQLGQSITKPYSSKNSIRIGIVFCFEFALSCIGVISILHPLVVF